MRIKVQIWIATAVIALCTLVLSGFTIGPTFYRYIEARNDLRDLEYFQLALMAANRISAERGPANDMMSADKGTGEAERARLTQFRAATDASLAALEAPRDAGGQAYRHPIPAHYVANTRELLRNARRNVDAIAAIPAADRPSRQLQAGIESMIAAMDSYQEAISWQVDALLRHDRETALAVIVGRIISDLREYGGRIGSHIVPALATRSPLQAADLARINMTRGRLLELRSLLDSRLLLSPDPVLADEAARNIDEIFFGQGLGIIDRLIAEGGETGAYSMSSQEFTRHFVARLSPLERARSEFLASSFKAYEDSRDDALLRLIGLTLVTLTAFGVLAAQLWSINASVLRPLLTARHVIIELADRRRHAPEVVSPSRSPEMLRLFEALSLLREKLIERTTYEMQLKNQADTDGLTGVLNRGALERIGQNEIDRRATSACLILVDLDHFKQINDRFGHVAGDRVLGEIANLLRRSVRKNDVVARFGGEEFAILIFDEDLNAVAELAEALRSKLDKHHIDVIGAPAPIRATASMGVAASGAGPDAWRQLVIEADAALYRAKAEGRNRVCVASSQGTLRIPA